MYSAFGNFYLRTPVYNIQKLESLPIDLGKFIEYALSDQYFMNAIKVASPVFFTEVAKLKEGLVHNRNTRKIGITLYKYWLRICHRSTPFGLFSGCLLGEISEESKIVLAQKELHRHAMRLDMEIVFAIAEYLSNMKLVKPQVRYRRNNTIYRTGTTYRYFEYVIVEGRRKYQLSHFYYSEYIEQLLVLAENDTTIDELVQCLANFEFDAEESGEFIGQLIDAQILVSEIHPPVTGVDPLSFIIRKIENVQGIKEIQSRLVRIRELLQADRFSESLIEIVKDLLAGVLGRDEVTNKNPLQLDLYLNDAFCSLDKALVDDIVNSTAALFPLKKHKKNDKLELFKKHFIERFEGQEVALDILMDVDTGIGYGSSNYDSYNKSELLEAVNFGSTDTVAEVEPDSFSVFQMRKLVEYYQKQQTEIIISEEDIKKFNDANEVPVSDNMFIRGSLLAELPGKLDHNNYRFLFSNCTGPSGVNFLGRFCNGSEELSRFSKEVLTREEASNSNAVFAEVLHIPQGRVANVSLRPVFRHYEIPCLTPSLLPPDRIISMNDIMVSVRDNEIILRSKRLNKQVIPRLSTAHNYNKSSVPAFKFLCDLQYHNIRPGFIWDWGACDNERFLPRVRYRNLILSRARWYFQIEELQYLLKDNVDLLKEFSILSTRYNIPRYLQLCENDNELFIDTNNINCLQVICEQLKLNRMVILAENLQLQDNAIVEDMSGGVYNNEMIIPIYKTEEKNLPVFPNYSHSSSLTRSFVPGSEWLYVKIYASPNTVESILSDIMHDLVDGLLQNNTIDGFFFVRFTDPDFHLRLRFHGKGRFWSTVLNSLYKRLDPLVKNGLVFKVCTDTYVREIERYGPQTMAYAEELFLVDSLFVLKVIKLFQGEDLKRDRWPVALKAVDMMLDDFQLDIEAKQDLCDRILASFLHSTDNSSLFKKQVDNKFRECRRRMHDSLSLTSRDGEALNALLRDRSKGIRKIVEQLTRIDQLPFEINDHLLPSYIHMLLNRLLAFNQKKQEIVIYALLSKYYRSMRAMEKYNEGVK
ncbi:MAG TPA: lantibiotic dehydratase [Chitinophaga sp.]|uniref:lantibiotic dehydratase n=1 Tax=Chitinophaga sp. TaxID=1869181 RepID=UPI002BB39B39|nr:lantibiotic dehydratase [Chitinophaga sp.]HVI43863.1 lantibiotic dehydratase [Chitinophaga sp.]